MSESNSSPASLHVSALRVWPLKSAAGVDVARVVVEPAGLAGDRRWLVIDDDGRMLTQREHPRLATLVVTAFDDGALGLPWGTATRPPEIARRRVDVTVWKDTFSAWCADDGHHAALSAWLGRRARLVHLGAPGARPVDASWLDGGDANGATDNHANGESHARHVVGFADGYPVLVVNAASVRAVADAAGVDVPLDRWRANIVVDGAPAWAEDGWSVLRLGDIELRLVKPCVRCVVTTTDQRRGVVAGNEPLATLARLRRSAHPRLHGVTFGMNAVVVRVGAVAIDDPVVVVATRPPWPLRT